MADSGLSMTGRGASGSTEFSPFCVFVVMEEADDD